MYEEIDLDAIESNKDEAPDYRPMLRSSGPSAPVEVDVNRYRVRILSSLESEERSRYDEFAKVADAEGMEQVARMFRSILKEEGKHLQALPDSRTVTNLRTSIVRENEKLEIIRSMLREAESGDDVALAVKLRKMLSEEERHVIMLGKALRELESGAGSPGQGPRPDAGEQTAMFCEFGKCVKKSRFEEDFDHLLSGD